MIRVKRRLLLDLGQVVNYGLAFNALNVELDLEQKSHFEAAGKDILSIRDPITPYDDGRDVEARIFTLCGVCDEAGLYKALRNDREDDTDVDVEDETWLFTAINNAITRYNERCSFFMVEHEYEDDLKAELGIEGAALFSLSLRKILMQRMITGNADFAISNLHSFLKEMRHPYKVPGTPYMEKNKARFAPFLATLNNLT